MRRTGIKRRTALAPGGPPPRKGSRPGRGAPIKPVNRKRKREAYARNFGPEADAVRAMPCSVHRALAIRGGWGADEWMIDEPWPDGWTPCTQHASDAAHVEPRGMGACSGDGRVGLVPLCRGHHEEAGEARTSKRAAFEARYGLNLRREADRIAVGHEPPLGIRGLEQRFAAELAIASFEDKATEEQVELARSAGVMSRGERDALMGWVRRRADRVFEENPDAAGEGAVLAALVVELGLSIDMAGALLDAAGWPS